jgi:hypothetical protein
MACTLAVYASRVDVGAMKPPAQPQKHRPSQSIRPPRTVSGLEARRAALALIEAALGRRGGMDEADASVLAGLESRDRGFARALALATACWASGCARRRRPR